MAIQTYSGDTLIVGAGIAGLVAALELVRNGQKVVLVDRDTPERIGGLARWAFGGMALVGTPMQAKLRIADTPQIALADWLRFGELGADDYWPRQWAEYYVKHSKSEVYDWLREQGLRFMPAVNWAERGIYGEGNSLPRYHVLWGGSLRMVEVLVEHLRREGSAKLTLLHKHRIDHLSLRDGRVVGAEGVNEADGTDVHFTARQVIVATGGINGALENVRRNWDYSEMPLPAELLNGATPLADGALHEQVREHGGTLTHTGWMWNYAAGIPHPQPHFPGHGLSLIPCKSALWLNHLGQRIGPQPLVTGFDTHELCRQVAQQEKPYTWQLMNWRIAAKELAISGSEHNPSIRDRKLLGFAREMLLGNHRLVQQLVDESPQVLAAETLAELVVKMNALTGSEDVALAQLQATVDAFDANFSRGASLMNDDQLRRILHARQWPSDRLRTCKPAPLLKRGSGPLIAMQVRLISRKSLGGIQTDLKGRVLAADGQPLAGLYAIGEAAGFGGGGASGKRSLEGTFLSGCILTARATARHLSKA